MTDKQNQFVIILNSLDGVELILKALRERGPNKGCIASPQLADGIENNLWILNDGVLTSEKHYAFEKESEKKSTVPLSVLPGGKLN